MPYERIMVAVDASETSNLALNEAISLSKTLNAHLVILHVFDVSMIHDFSLTTNYEKYRKEVKKDGLSILKKARSEAVKNECSVDTVEVEITDINTKTSEKLIEAAESNHLDLLVLGTHGRSA